jgi:hypothetical protein
MDMVVSPVEETPWRTQVPMARLHVAFGCIKPAQSLLRTNAKNGQPCACQGSAESMMIMMIILLLTSETPRPQHAIGHRKPYRE